MFNRSYYRTFVILKSNDDNFGLTKGKNPAGYCKIEVRNNRGKMEAYIQDMKKTEPEEGLYYLVFASKDTGIKPLILSEIKVDSNGKGKCSLSFDPVNISNSGYSLDSYHGISIAYISSTNKAAMKYPLVGYSDKQIAINWHTYVTAGLVGKYESQKQDMGLSAIKGSESSKEDKVITDINPNIAEVVENDENKMIDTDIDTDPCTKDEHKQSFGFEASKAEANIQSDNAQADDNLLIDNDDPDSEVYRNKDDLSFEDSSDNLEGFLFTEQDIIEEEQKEIDLMSNDSDLPAQDQDITLADESDNIDASELTVSDNSEPPDEVSNEAFAESNEESSDASVDEHESSDDANDKKKIGIMSLDTDEIRADNAFTFAEDKPKRARKESFNRNIPNADIHGAPTYWDRVQDYYTRLFSKHKRVCPFNDPVGEVDWIRIEHVNDDPYSYYPGGPYGSKSTISSLDHYLVGIVREKGKVKYVAYGIPGIYSVVPPMSMHGFSRWLPVKNGYGSGYWLLYIDAEKGSIAYPY